MKPAKRDMWLFVIATLILLPPMAMSVRTFYRFMYRDFVVHNAGAAPIRIIVVGTRSKEIVPLWTRTSPEFQKSIAPGTQASFGYTADGENLCWLLVDAGDGRLHVLNTPLGGRMCELSPPTKTWPCCHFLDEDTVLTVPAVTQLELAPEVLTSLVPKP